MFRRCGRSVRAYETAAAMFGGRTAGDIAFSQIAPAMSSASPRNRPREYRSSTPNRASSKFPQPFDRAAGLGRLCFEPTGPQPVAAAHFRAECDSLAAIPPQSADVPRRGDHRRPATRKFGCLSKRGSPRCCSPSDCGQRNVQGGPRIANRWSQPAHRRRARKLRRVEDVSVNRINLGVSSGSAQRPFTGTLAKIYKQAAAERKIYPAGERTTLQAATFPAANVAATSAAAQSRSSPGPASAGPAFAAEPPIFPANRPWSAKIVKFSGWSAGADRATPQPRIKLFTCNDSDRPRPADFPRRARTFLEQLRLGYVLGSGPEVENGIAVAAPPSRRADGELVAASVAPRIPRRPGP